MTLRTLSSTVLISLLTAGAAHAQSDAALERHERNLVEAAKKAVATADFETRNRIHATAVTAEAAPLAGRAVNADPRAQAHLERVFRSAVFEAGEAFRGDGKGAPSAAGPIAFNHVAGAFAALEGRPVPSMADAERAAGLADRVRVEDIERMVIEDLKLERGHRDGRHLVENIDRVVPQSDWFRSEIPNIPRRAPGEKPLSATELNALRISARLPNATWKSGQAHRAYLENKPERIDPKSAGNYTTFDGMMRRIYQRAFADAERSITSQVEDRLSRPIDKELRASIRRDAARRALARTVFEVYKDIHELRKAAAKATKADARRTRQRLRNAYADALAKKSIPQLVAEARARGIDLRKSRRLLTKEAIVSRLSGLSPQKLAERAAAQARTTATRVETKVEGARGRLQGLIPGRSSGRPVRGR